VGKAGEEIHTDEFGRIKVQFHWDRYSPANENTPCWVRVSQLWAGKNWGSVFLPRIGQEVIVEFLDGNPDRPIVTGAVYNGESKPPYPLPDNATMSTIKSNSSKGGQGFNEFRFEDKKGEEMIFTHAEKDQDTRVKNDTKEWIGNDRHLIVKANQTELVEGDKGAEVKGDQLLKVGGDMGSNITGNQITKIGGNLHANVSSAIHLKAGADIRLSAGANADIKGGAIIVIEGGAQLSLKAGGSFVDIGPAGVSISGAMVNINTGGAAGTAQAASPESPDAPGAAAEASDAEPGSSDEAMTAPTPPEPAQFSPSCLAMQEAAADGTHGRTVTSPVRPPLRQPMTDSDSDRMNSPEQAEAARPGLAGPLFGKGDVPVFGVLDGASVRGLVKNLRARAECCCLYRGELEPDTASVAPYSCGSKRTARSPSGCCATVGARIGASSS
jgi:type VI secretion system secreted protein VgrG